MTTVAKSRLASLPSLPAATHCALLFLFEQPISQKERKKKKELREGSDTGIRKNEVSKQGILWFNGFWFQNTMGLWFLVSKYCGSMAALGGKNVMGCWAFFY